MLISMLTSFLAQDIYIPELEGIDTTTAFSDICRVGTHSSTHQYKLPVNFSTNPTSGGSL